MSERDEDDDDVMSSHSSYFINHVKVIFYWEGNNIPSSFNKEKKTLCALGMGWKLNKKGDKLEGVSANIKRRYIMKRRKTAFAMDEQIKSVDQRLDSFAKRQEAMNKIGEEALGKFLQAINDLQKQIYTPVRLDHGQGSGGFNLESGNSFVRNLPFMPKLEFPKFNGSNSRTWIKKCSKYFELCKISDDQKLDIASLHMADKAVEQFNKLQQTISLETYIDDFENLRSVMLQSNHVLPEGYILDSFIGGLKSAVKPFAKAFKPTSISDAIEYARYERGHKCKFKEPQLFTVEVPGESIIEDKEEGVDEVVEPCISGSGDCQEIEHFYKTNLKEFVAEAMLIPLGSCDMLCHTSTEVDTTLKCSNNDIEHPELQKLKSEFQAVFEEPLDLPLPAEESWIIKYLYSLVLDQ
ncbi:hypothetical protein AgCh_024478 [Apium graveolens]